MSGLNILQIIPRIPAPPIDGGAIYIYHITKELAHLGHHVTQLAFESNRHPQDTQMIREFATIESIPVDFRSYSLGAAFRSLYTRLPITVQHRMDKSKMQILLDRVKNQSFDRILIEGIHAAFFIPDIRETFPGVPIILRQSNVEHLVLERNSIIATNPFVSWFYKRQAILMHRFEKQAMNAVDGVTAISNYDRSYFFKDTNDLKCEVIPAGAYLPKLRDIQRESETIVAISNWKWFPNLQGIEWFVEKVWPILKKDHVFLKLQIAGHGLPNHLASTFRNQEIEYLGFVDDIEGLRQKSILMIAPLFSGSGMKLKVLESLASGLPVITTSLGAQGIDMEPETHYLEANNTHQFADQIIRLLNDQSLQKNLSLNGRNLIRDKYLWETQAKKLESFLQSFTKN